MFVKGGFAMRYNTETKELEMTVAELCLLSVGEDYSKSAADTEAINEVASADDGYLKSLPVCQSFVYGAKTIKMSGVADGYFEKKDGARVDFVKSVSEKEFAKSPKAELFTYVKCVAWLICKRDGLDSIYPRLVLKDSSCGEIRCVEKRMTAAELELFVNFLLSTVTARINHVVRHETYVRPSALGLPFPYSDIREGQDEMMHGVTTAIRKGKRMFAQAPTGIGKTISVLYPAVRAFGKGQCDKIFYFTAKNETTKEAYSAASRLYEAGAKLKTIVLSSKDSMCRSEKAKAGGSRDSRYCNERDCPYRKRYKDKAGAAIEELLSRQNGFYSSIITEVALKHQVCPYELSLDLSELCDIIICDYNYLFDPFVRLKRYFESSFDFGDYVFLIDEAHNLVDRARTIYSSALTLSALENAAELVSLGAPELAQPFKDMLEAMKKAKGLCKENKHTDTDGNETGYYI